MEMSSRGIIVDVLFVALWILPRACAFFNPYIPNVPVNCINPHDDVNPIVDQTNGTKNLPTCILPFYHVGPLHRIGHGAKMNETSEPLLYYKSNYTLNWAFYRSVNLEDLAGKMASTCLVVHPLPLYGSSPPSRSRAQNLK